MSVRCISWALNDAPVSRTSARFVLVGLADHAGDDGRHAFPSIATLCRYTGLSERAVRTQLRFLEELRLIRPSENQGAAAAHIGRADRRPTVYDLNLGLSVEFVPGRPGPVGEPGYGGQDVPPAEPVDNPPDGGQQMPPVDATGGISRPDGGHLTTERGAADAPEPSLNRPENHNKVDQKVDAAVDNVRLVFDTWVTATGRDPARTVLDPKRRRRITQALARFPLDDILDAVRGWQHSPFHRGENERARPYHDLDLLLRDAEHIETFRDLERTVTGHPSTHRPRQTVTEWLAIHGAGMDPTDADDLIDQLVTQGRLSDDRHRPALHIVPETAS